MLIVVQNLKRGGLKSTDGSPEDRWPALAARITSAGTPDLVLLQETEGWTADSHRQLVRAEEDLDMDGLIAPSRSGLGTAILYRRETLGRRTGWNVDYAADQTHHGTGVASWNLPKLPSPLSVMSVHFTPYSADMAVAEAGFCGSRVYKHGPYALIAGDVNFAPQDGPTPAYERMRPYNRGSRALLHNPASDEPPTPDRRVAWTLAGKGLVDAARHLHQQTGDAAALAPTAGGDRIDQLWVSEPLAPCLRAYRVLTEPASASDHHGLAVELDLSAADIHTWQYE